MWKVTLKGIWSKKVRFLLTSVAVLLGVAFVSGTFVLTATISQSFDNLFGEIYANTDAVVRGKAQFDDNFNQSRPRIPASLLPAVQSASGVAAADGSVSGEAKIIDRNDKVVGANGQGPPSIGLSWVKDPKLNSLTVVEGRAPRAPNEIVIDKKSADDAGYAPGDTVPVVTQAGRDAYKLAGVAKFGSSNSLLGATIVAFTQEKAWEVLAPPDTFNEIDVRADSGVSQDQVVHNIRAALRDQPGSGNVEVITGAAITKENQNNVKDALGFFNTFLLVFAIVALLVGSFIIFNTFSIIVAQRGRELALLRALGAGQRQVLGSVLFEAVLVGLVASTLGLVAGIFLATALKALLAAFGLDIPGGSVVIPASAIVWSYATGLFVTVVAALAPAWRASRVPPIAALRDASLDRSATSRVRIVSGLAVIALGALLLGVGLFGNADNALLIIGLGVLVVFFGVAALGPTIAAPVSGLIGLPIRAAKGITGSLARENAMRNPKRTSATAAALMIGVALVGLITIFAASARASFGAAIDRSMKADYVVNTKGFGPGAIPVGIEAALADVPGVESVSGVRATRAKMDGSVDFLWAADPKKIDSLFDLQPQQGQLSKLTEHGIGVLDSIAADKNLKVGDEVQVVFPSTGPQTFTVETIFKQAGFASWVIGLDAYQQNVPDQFDSQVYIKTTDGVTPGNTAALKKVVAKFPGPELQTRQEFKDAQIAQVNQLLNLIYVLLFFAIMIALFGIANTLGLSIIERRHELGLLRAVGMTRRQLRSSVRWESVIIALLGTVLGLIIGVLVAWAMVHALADQGFDRLSLAPMQLALIVVLAAVFGVVAAILPARRAARLDILESIHTE
jgi:putative ABC transport system permease protein